MTASGAEEGRAISPLISPSDWDAVLSRTRFSGVDTITPQTHTLPCSESGFILQATSIDDRLMLLRQPTQNSAENSHQRQLADGLVLLRGNTARSIV